MKKPNVFKMINFYPPYLGAGVKVKQVAQDYSHIQVQMKLKFWNKNYVGTHFGGSLYSMVDPFYMLMLMKLLGKNYIVWDKEAQIKFIKPGKGTVFADFHISNEEVEKIKKSLEENDKCYPEFQVLIKDAQGQTVAKAHKILYVSKKNNKQKDNL